MKKTALCLACFSSFLLLTATLLYAAEKKTVFNTERIKFETGTGPVRCQDKCGRRSGPDVNSLLSQGWKIVGSSPKEVTGEEYWYVPCNACEPHGCTCFGTEYLLERDAPTRRVEASDNGIYTPDGNRSAPITAREAENSVNELELLKRKNELLNKEISSLKRENEGLKNLLKSMQK